MVTSKDAGMTAKKKKPRKRGRQRVDSGLDARIGALMRQRRNELGWSQQVLGDKLGLTFQQVQKYENGANQLSVARLIQVAKVLGVPAGHFLEVNGKIRPVENFDYDAARIIAGIDNTRLRAAILRLARECHRSRQPPS